MIEFSRLVQGDGSHLGCRVFQGEEIYDGWLFSPLPFGKGRGFEVRGWCRHARVVLNQPHLPPLPTKGEATHTRLSHSIHSTFRTDSRSTLAFLRPADLDARTAISYSSPMLSES